MKNINLTEKIPKILTEIAVEITNCGGRTILVGGVVRDLLLNLPLKDFDLEIYGIDNFDTLKAILTKYGSVNEVGKAFAVLKFTAKKIEADFAFPRTENKIGKGHKGFQIISDPNLDFKEAAQRRDFTINSMGIDLTTHEFLDPFNGKKDLLEKRLIKHVGPKFTEDPLRVYRAMQFAARFNLTIHPETVEIAKTCDLTELPKERIFEEVKKMFLLSKKPSIGLRYWPKLGIIKVFPELEALIGVPEEPLWHPEGDVWTHTLMVVDEMAKTKQGDSKKDLVFLLAALTHDFGKPKTTAYIEGSWRSRGHEDEGVEPAKNFLMRLTNETDLIGEVLKLVKEHLKPALLYKDNLKNPVSDGAIRRLSLRVNILDLLKIAEADHFGRTTADAIEREFPAGEWLLKKAQELQVKDEKPKPLIMGRDLIDLGFKSSPELGKILKACFELQLEGTLTTKEELLNYARNLPENKD